MHNESLKSGVFRKDRGTLFLGESKMKRIIVMFSVLLVVLLCGAAFAEEAPEDALEMTRRMGNGINLGNTMEACNNGKLGGNTNDFPKFYETYWGQPETTPEMLRAMKDSGFDTIRIPVAWMTNAAHLNKGDYTISEKYMDRVEEIRKEGGKVVLKGFSPHNRKRAVPSLR